MMSSIYLAIALIPFVILMISIFIIILSMIFKRNHMFVAIVSGMSLILLLWSLFIIRRIIPIYITSLIYIDFYTLWYVFIIVFSGLFINILAYFSLRNVFLYKEEFYLLFLISILGAIFLVFSNHMFSLFLGIELMSLPVIGLMTYSYFQKKSIEVALKYIILSIISSNFMLFGISLIYVTCGNLDFSSIKISFLIDNLSNNKVLLFGIGFLLISFFFKLSLFPLHFWIPDIYKYTSPVVLCYLTTVIKVSMFGILIKLFLYFPYHQSKILYLLIYVVSIFSIFFGSVMSLFQNNIKKLLGYSSISHIGYIIITLLIIEKYKIANESALIYLISYTISNVSIFGILSISEILQDVKQIRINDSLSYLGFFKEQPVLSIAMTIVMLSFLGIPMTFGFISKFYIIMLSTLEHFWLINFSILINSVLSLYYYLRIIINLYSTNKQANLNYSFLGYLSFNIQIVLFVLILLIILLGIFPQIIINFF
ncbi:NADH-quinone oxidoreductase subunit N [Buchnera aphidicola]|uniref:NADH-quinone oxidoreductase subunit N n=1 Tax=Buchnera aphidicola TaxID=9 RepID=UPI0034645220